MPSRISLTTGDHTKEAIGKVQRIALTSTLSDMLHDLLTPCAVLQPNISMAFGGYILGTSRVYSCQ